MTPEGQAVRPRPMTEDEVLALFASCSNRGRWGEQDELGTLNYITEAKRIEAAQEVVLGRVISMAHDLETVASTKLPYPMVHRMLYVGPDAIGCADSIEIASHSFAITHLDALAHVYYQDRLYNGRSVRDVVQADGLHFGSVHAVRDGIVTRGVLLDVARARGVSWLGPHEGVWPADLEAAESLAGVRVESGDAVIVRVGLGAREDVEGAEDPTVRAGLVAECLPWLHERQVALYSGDCIEQLPQPYPGVSQPLHMIGFGAMGLALLDIAAVEPLAAMCQALSRYHFMFLCAPLRIPGGTCSPVNPLCVF